MKVYVVLAGEKHEGASVEGVFTTKEKAVDAAMKVRYHFEGGWQWDGIEPHDLEWVNGCDYVMVREYEVQ